MVAGLILFGLGWTSLIYGLYEEYMMQRLHEECQRLNDCWEFTTSGFNISPFSLGGVVLIAIGGVLIISGRRALRKALWYGCAARRESDALNDYVHVKRLARWQLREKAPWCHFQYLYLGQEYSSCNVDLSETQTARLSNCTIRPAIPHTCQRQ